MKKDKTNKKNNNHIFLYLQAIFSLITVVLILITLSVITFLGV